MISRPANRLKKEHIDMIMGLFEAIPVRDGDYETAGKTAMAEATKSVKSTDDASIQAAKIDAVNNYAISLSKRITEIERLMTGETDRIVLHQPEAGESTRAMIERLQGEVNELKELIAIANSETYGAFS